MPVISISLSRIASDCILTLYRRTGSPSRKSLDMQEVGRSDSTHRVMKGRKDDRFTGGCHCCRSSRVLGEMGQEGTRNEELEGLPKYTEMSPGPLVYALLTYTVYDLTISRK